jgi:non-specific serine/threonine protein kinase
MLETVREYAAEQLDVAGEREAMAQAHARYYTALTTEAEPELVRGQQAVWLNRLEQERDNVRAALRWSLQEGGDRALGVQMAAALWRFWYTRGRFSEGRRWLELALVWAEATTVERARVLIAAGIFAFAQGDMEQADAWYTEGLAMARQMQDARAINHAVHNLGMVAEFQGDYTRAADLFAESLTLARAEADPWATASALVNLGWLAKQRGDWMQAVARYEETLALVRTLDDWQHLAWSLALLGNTLVVLGDYARAQGLYEEGLAAGRAAQSTLTAAMCLCGLGTIALDTDQREAALGFFKEGLRLARESGAVTTQVSTLGGMSALAQQRGDAAAARALAEEGLRLARTSLRQDIAEALATVGHRARERGDLAQALTCYRESLEQYRALGTTAGVAACVEGAAAVLLSAGSPARAVRLWGAASALRAAQRTPLPPADRGAHQQALAAARQELGAREFDAAWAMGAARTPEQAIAEALVTGEDVGSQTASTGLPGGMLTTNP